jgi:2-amino-4-hydroxy-6-hydroxymethyldihydropteridine diphosphokinase
MPEIFVSIGSSLQREDNVRAALKALRKRFGSIRYSSVYKTEAVGFIGDYFFNLVASFESNDDPQSLKQFLRSVENKQGRVRNEKMPGPCPLDFDLLLYGDRIINSPELVLPRADVLKYAFVLEPLAELSPEQCYPGTDNTYRDLWSEYYCQHNTRCLARLSWDPLEKPRLQKWCYPDYTLAI